MKNLNFYAPINHTGYGLASINILKELTKQFHVSLFPIGGVGVSSQTDYDITLESINRSSVFDPQAPCLKIWHQFDLASKIANGRYFAYPFFELDTFNSKEKLHLSIPDEIIVSCEWAKQVMIDNGVKKTIHVAPLGVDTSIFNWQNSNTIDKYIFLTIGKWEVRKSHELLPQIFKQAFPTEKDVELWILAAEHTNNYCSSEDLKNWKSLYSQDPRFKIIPGVQHQKDLAKIIAQSNCGIYISKAEGWNLELLETMAMNKPAIATNYSAHTEFCDTNNCYLVDIAQTEPAHDNKAFVGQGNWAKIGQNQIDQTISYMRYVYKNKISINPNGLNTAKKYSWTNTVDSLSRCIC